MKQSGRRLISALVLFIFSFSAAFLLIGSLLLYAYHQELKEDLDRSLNALAEDLIHHKLYLYDLSDMHKKFHMLDTSDALYEGLTFAYHPQKPKPVIGAGVIKKLPDGRYLTAYSSLKRVNAKTFALAKELLILFGALLLLFTPAFALFLKKRFTKHY